MDMLMADVTGLDVSPGDEVIIGSQKGLRRHRSIDVREMAPHRTIHGGGIGSGPAYSGLR
jgi:alanine racemase